MNGFPEPLSFSLYVCGCMFVYICVPLCVCMFACVCVPVCEAAAVGFGFLITLYLTTEAGLSSIPRLVSASRGLGLQVGGLACLAFTCILEV